jgi:hypothetical protein
MIIKSRAWAGWVSVVVTGVFVCACFSGCTTFRRKFVRQNKNKETKEDFIPVLEPVDYKPVMVAPVDGYRDHYAMVKAYIGDIYTALGSSDSSGKREVYLLNQLIAHLQGMSAALTGARKADADGAVSQIQALLAEFDKPAAMRRGDLLKGRVHGVEMDIRRKLKPDMVREFLIVQ